LCPSTPLFRSISCVLYTRTLDVPRTSPIHSGVEAISLLQRGRQHVGLEGRTRLGRAQERAVVLVGDVVVSTVEPQHLAGGRVDGGQSQVHVLGQVLHRDGLLHRLVGGL